LSEQGGFGVLTSAALDRLQSFVSGSSLFFSPSGQELCEASGTARYPIIGGVPWLYADPDAALFQWRLNISHHKAFMQSEEAALLSAWDALPKSRKLARQRLKALLDARRHDTVVIKELMRPLMESSSGVLDALGLLAEKIPVTQSLTGYYANIHRDWSWDDLVDPSCNENKRALQLVVESATPLLTGRPFTGILGAGACRLAFDIHMTGAPLETMALDINPLLFAVAKRVVQGENLNLTEYPVAPKTLADGALRRVLKAPQPVGPGFSFVHADALNPPLKPGSLDWLVTPWFIDILPHDPAQVLAVINGLLPMGGLWTNFGTVVFHAHDIAARWSVDELLEGIRESGFSLDQPPRFEPIRYLCSPASLHGREEVVLCFTARKVAESRFRQRTRPSFVPEWARQHELPVPMLASFSEFFTKHRTYAQIASLVDGKRSVVQIAQIMCGMFGMTQQDAIQSFLKVMLTVYEQQANASSGARL
jgi:hypothetical protein